MLPLAVVLCLAAVSVSCSSSDDEPRVFDYPMETVYGTWDLVAMQQSGSGEWIDLTTEAYASYRAYITFKPDGTFSGREFTHAWSGTYAANGNTIIVYENGEEYLRYIVRSVSGNIMEGTQVQKNGAYNFKARKRN